MKPRASNLAVLLLTVILSRPASANQRWCGDCLVPCCPPQSMGWTLFLDENIGTPDFWYTVDSVTVREIYRCEHGVQFLFVTNQGGRPTHTALVFPNPSRKMLAERLGLELGSAKLEQEYNHFAARYAALTKALEDLTGGTLVVAARVSFENPVGADAPIIIPKNLLALRWRGQQILLRGYLDVYFAPVI